VNGWVSALLPLWWVGPAFASRRSRLREKNWECQRGDSLWSLFGDSVRWEQQPDTGHERRVRPSCRGIGQSGSPCRKPTALEWCFNSHQHEHRPGWLQCNLRHRSSATEKLG